ncbi:unnamed protein product [Cuscuta campestris]|uniref:Uncharacterized protein n=1 Tax=Cuscuta campestris TaxID=132261 RepID=A0A484LG10_9ASTE|nr:unnamed protein product [Cuscuta campestris]
MAGFFSLGGGRGRDAGGDNSNAAGQPQSSGNNNRHSAAAAAHISPESWFLLRNDQDIPPAYKGFELWQDQPSIRHHQHHHQISHLQDLYSSAAAAAGLTRNAGGVLNASTSAVPAAEETSRSAAALVMMSGSGGISCQDCGNQAKKDCSHMRCRTCCRSRGFQCNTHVKSTWVPAAKRRERQLLNQQHQQLSSSSTASQSQDTLQLRGGGTSRETPKRHRDDPNASSRLPSAISGLEMGNFPAKVSLNAAFHCVRMRSIDDSEDQCAYRAAVNIGGHVFKGILYDQGPESQYMAAGESSSGGSAGGGAHTAQHNLLSSGGGGCTAATATSGSASGGGGGEGQAAPLYDPSLFSSSAPLCSFMAGTQFFPPPRS